MNHTMTRWISGVLSVVAIFFSVHLAFAATGTVTVATVTVDGLLVTVKGTVSDLATIYYSTDPQFLTSNPVVVSPDSKGNYSATIDFRSVPSPNPRGRPDRSRVCRPCGLLGAAGGARRHGRSSRSEGRPLSPARCRDSHRSRGVRGRARRVGAPRPGRGGGVRRPGPGRTQHLAFTRRCRHLRRP